MKYKFEEKTLLRAVVVSKVIIRTTRLFKSKQNQSFLLKSLLLSQSSLKDKQGQDHRRLSQVVTKYQNIDKRIMVLVFYFQSWDLELLIERLKVRKLFLNGPYDCLYSKRKITLSTTKVSSVCLIPSLPKFFAPVNNILSKNSPLFLDLYYNYLKVPNFIFPLALYPLHISILV